eukprot:8742933-Pyramimonas_sp.AAC.1
MACRQESREMAERQEDAEKGSRTKGENFPPAVKTLKKGPLWAQEGLEFLGRCVDSCGGTCLWPRPAAAREALSFTPCVPCGRTST